MTVGEAVQYYKDGWRYGIVKHIPVRGKKLGEIQITHPMTGEVWIPAADVRELK